MSIKKGAQITASDINDLKTKVISIYNTRSFLSDAGYTTTTLTANSSGFGNTPIESGKSINQNFYYSLNALLQLNDIQNITASNTTGDYIFKNSHETEDLITIVNNWNNIPKKTPDNISTKPISCRGGCVGLCWNHCDGECTYECTASSVGYAGEDGSQQAPGQQTGSDHCIKCVGKCKGSCDSVCWQECNDGCKGGCFGACTGACDGVCTGCSTDCSGGCANGCKDNCASGSGAVIM